MRIMTMARRRTESSSLRRFCRHQVTSCAGSRTDPHLAAICIRCSVLGYILHCGIANCTYLHFRVPWVPWVIWDPLSSLLLARCIWCVHCSGFRVLRTPESWWSCSKGKIKEWNQNNSSQGTRDLWKASGFQVILLPFCHPSEFRMVDLRGAEMSA